MLLLDDMQLKRLSLVRADQLDDLSPGRQSHRQREMLSPRVVVGPKGTWRLGAGRGRGGKVRSR